MPRLKAGEPERITERVISNRYLAEALRYLARLAAGEGGYMLRGVRGWAHRHQVEIGTRLRQDGQLPRLFSMRLVDRIELGPPSGRGRKAWLYRINDAGARVSAATWGEAYQRVRVPRALERPAPVYLASNPANALAVLRLAYDLEEGPKRFGERGWRTGRELTLFVEELRSTRSAELPYLDSMELQWLAAVGLADKRDEKLTWGRERPVVFWRVSEAGRTARLLSWYTPDE